MIFRFGDRNQRRTERGAERLDEVLAACFRTFDRAPEAVDADGIVLEGVALLYDPTDDGPSFVVRPACDRCSTTDLEQFPLEEWAMFGVAVRGQSRSSCRDCRFLHMSHDPRTNTARAS